MHEAQRVAWNAGLMIAKQGVMAVLGVLFVGYMARTVGVAAWGEFQASLAITAIAAIVAGLGVRGYVAREIAMNSSLGPRYLGSALIIRGVTGTIILSAIAIVSLTTRSAEGQWLVPIAAASQLATLLYTTMWLSFEVHERFQYIVYVELGARLFVLTMATLCIAWGLGIVGAAIIFAMGNAIELALTYHFLCRRLYAPSFETSTSELVSIAKRSLPFGFVGALLGAVRQSDRVLLRWFGDESMVGIFSAGAVLVEQLEVLSDLVFGAAFSVGVRLYAGDPNRFLGLYRTAIVTAIAIGLPIGAGTCLLAPDIIHLVYGTTGFVGADRTLRVLAWHIPATFAFHVTSLPLIAGKREAALGAVLLPALVATFTLDRYLVPRHGAFGAASTALVVSIAVVSALLALTPACAREIPLGRIRAAIVATGCMVLVVSLVHRSWGVWMSILAGVVTYVLLSFGLRLVTLREIQLLLKPGMTMVQQEKPSDAKPSPIDATRSSEDA